MTNDSGHHLFVCTAAKRLETRVTDSSVVEQLGVSTRYSTTLTYVGRGGALVETMTFNRRVVGSTSALAAMHVGTLGKSFTCSCLCASA